MALSFILAYLVLAEPETDPLCVADLVNLAGKQILPTRRNQIARGHIKKATFTVVCYFGQIMNAMWKLLAHNHMMQNRNCQIF